MSRSRAHRWLSRLALVAMLLLASLPTLGRLASPVHALAHAGSMAGHAMPPMPGHAPHGAPVPHEHHEDCDYCVLLAGAVPTPMSVPVVAAAPPGVWVSTPPESGVIAAPMGPGLGARGPPRAA